MTVPSHSQNIQMIPLAQITVLNPRARNKQQHREIVDNIDAVGLKRPITVSRRASGGDVRYDLICGEGRLEAFRMLGAADIPAIVIEAPENDCLVMSLVENIVRRQHRPLDIMQEIGSLHSRGYSDAEIAKKIGCTASWVGMINILLARGDPARGPQDRLRFRRPYADATSCIGRWRAGQIVGWPARPTLVSKSGY